MQFGHKKVIGNINYIPSGDNPESTAANSLPRDVSATPDDALRGAITKLAAWKHGLSSEPFLTTQRPQNTPGAKTAINRGTYNSAPNSIGKGGKNFHKAGGWKRYGESGSALLMVLVIGLFLVMTTVVTLTVTRGSLAQSSNYSVHSYASLAAQAGLSDAVSEITSALPSGPSTYPCSLSGTLPNSNASTIYSVTITYSDSGATENCNGGGNGQMASTLGSQSAAPNSAVIISTGEMEANTPLAKNNQVEMEESISISGGQTAVPNEAILTEAPLILNNQYSITGGSGVGPADVSSPHFSCSATSTIDGNVIAGTSGAQVTGSCNVTGSISSNGPVYITGNVLGNVTAWLKGLPMSSSGITITNGGYAPGNVISYGAGINIGSVTLTTPVGNAGTVVDAYNGNLSMPYTYYLHKGVSYNATGTITINGVSSHGTLPSATGTPTAVPPFPKTDPIPATGGQNVTETITGFSCMNFTNAFTQDVMSFNMLHPGATTLTINANTCNNVTVSQNVLFNENVNLYVGSLDIGGTSGFGQACLYTYNTESSCQQYTGGYGFGPGSGPLPPGTQSAPYYAFRVFAGTGNTSGSGCGAFGSTTANVDITGSGAAIIASDIHLFIYTPGSVSLGNQVSITGQIYACSGMAQGGGGVGITYYPTSALLQNIQGTPSVSIENEYLLKG